MSSDLHVMFVAHGSPTPGYTEEVQAFARAWLQLHAGATAEVAYLESLAPCLSDSLKQSPATVVAPLFLHEGVHTQQDITHAIAAAGKNINLLPSLISEPFLLEALLGRLDEAGADGTAMVLYSHGSRDAGTLVLLNSLASRIEEVKGLPCLIAVARGGPGLESQLVSLSRRGEKQVTVLPHFLFGGLWKEKIQTQVEEAEKVFDMRIRVAPPLGCHPAMLAMVDSFVAEMEVNRG